MQKKEIKIEIEACKFDELNESEQLLVKKAQEATNLSYAPYSDFHVGAAILMENGEIVLGSNQEMAAYPSGLCAERTAMFHATSHYKNVAPIAIAIAAVGTDGRFLAQPVTPCGSCRQVLVEVESRFQKPIKVLLYGTEVVYKLRNTKDLMPLAFDSF